MQYFRPNVLPCIDIMCNKRAITTSSARLVSGGLRVFADAVVQRHRRVCRLLLGRVSRLVPQRRREVDARAARHAARQTSRARRHADGPARRWRHAARTAQAPPAAGVGGAGRAPGASLRRRVLRGVFGTNADGTQGRVRLGHDGHLGAEDCGAQAQK